MTNYSKQTLIDNIAELTGTIHTDLQILLVEYPIPEQFWVAPASMSGRYHPQLSLGVGGLVRHTLMVMWWVTRWARFVDATPLETQCAVVAAALHDTYKGGWADDWTTTVPEHPLIAAGQVEKLARNIDKLGLPDEAATTFRKVKCGIKTHMGVWSPDINVLDYETYNPEHIGSMNKIQKMVALADYSASQKTDEVVKALLSED